MKEKISALHSNYVIDGIQMPLTPAGMLDECLVKPRKDSAQRPDACFGDIVDESVDPTPNTYAYDNSKIDEYLAGTVALSGSERVFPIVFAGPFTRSRIARTLIDCIWAKGNFALEDLILKADWKWDPEPMGSMAAFYASAEAAADYIDSLGLNLGSYSFTRSEEGNALVLKARTTRTEGPGPDEADELDISDSSLPFGNRKAVMGRSRAVGDKMLPEGDSWLIYIPFESCGFRLGGSVLAQTVGCTGNAAPEINDPDYFIDCYEVVRELVEDGVVIAGATVSDGGLLTALQGMCSAGTGTTIDVKDIMDAYKEEEMIRVLFAEVPGVIIQIRDIDFDYVDAELLLQDVAFFPLGHPAPGEGRVQVESGRSGGIALILQSLLGNQVREGED